MERVIKSRKERRQEARENNVSFEPQYNGRVITKAEYDKEVQEHKELLKEMRKNRFKKSSQVEEVAEEVTETE